MNQETTIPKPPSNKVDVCLSGFGIVCGLEVHINDDCSIDISSGTIVMPTGLVRHVEKKLFKFYLLVPDEGVSAYLKKLNPEGEEIEFWKLAGGEYNEETMDSLKQQFLSDEQEQNFLDDKILIIIVAETAEGPKLVFVLIAQEDVALITGISEQGKCPCSI